MVQLAIVAKNQNFGQKSKFWSKIEILVKNQHFVLKREILMNNLNKIILNKIILNKIIGQTIGQKLLVENYWSKTIGQNDRDLAKNRNSRENSSIWSNIRFLVVPCFVRPIFL